MKLLDLFCGAGGAAMGYSRAGFDIVGIDHVPQPHYPFEFVQADALEYLAKHGHEFDAIHASPPCQFASIMRNLPWLKDRDYPALILPTRDMLLAIARPFVIENVWGARYGAKGLKTRGLEAHGMQAGWLCGGMFGLPFYRHRLFETSFFWLAPGHPRHRQTIRAGRSLGGRARGIVYAKVGKTIRAAGDGAQVEGAGVGHAKGWQSAASGMGIDWMKRDELTQAIPPCYTEFVGTQLMKVLA